MQIFIYLLYMFRVSQHPSPGVLKTLTAASGSGHNIGTATSLQRGPIRLSLQHEYHSNPTTPKLQHTSNQEQYDKCGNSTEQSQAPDDGYINVRNMLST